MAALGKYRVIDLRLGSEPFRLTMSIAQEASFEITLVGLVNTFPGATIVQRDCAEPRKR
jgi:hypothetical protein